MWGGGATHLGTKAYGILGPRDDVLKFVLAQLAMCIPQAELIGSKASIAFFLSFLGGGGGGVRTRTHLAAPLRYPMGTLLRRKRAF